ncbi:MAG TPA: EAL domain-containing protein [Rhodocyclaceae bacterium]|nr:EAL domain-containing protein [Rhodocyclaceae bacterium]
MSDPRAGLPGPATVIDLRAAARLCQAIVLAENVDAAEVGVLCRQLLASDEAEWVDAAAAARRATDDPLLDAALRSNTAQSAGDRVALRVDCAGNLLLVRQAGGVGDSAYGRLAALSELLGEALGVRADLDARRQSQRILETRTRTQNEIINHLHDSVIVMDLAGFISSWNQGAERLFGYTADEALGRHILFLYADEADGEDLPFNRVLADHGREMTVRRRKKSGEVFWASITLSLMRDEAGEPTGIVGYLVDITDRLATETQLQLHARIFDQSSEAIIVTDAGFRIVSVNRAFVDMTGLTATEVLGQVPGVLRPCSFASGLSTELRTTLERQGHWQGELWDWRKDGQIFPVWGSITAIRNPAGEITNCVVVMSDITQRKEAEAQIYRLAYYDALTGLPNRELLFTLVEQALAEAHRQHGHGALLFVDINRFKHVNDSFGHDAADVLLREIAQRLRQSLREPDVVARVGGDEFVIGLFGLASRGDAAVVARQLMAALGQPFHVNHLELIVSASVGIAIYPDDGRDAETLIRAADVAQQRAKHGTEGWLFYAQDMNMRSIERLKLETGLRRAIDHQQFVLHYQPQIDFASGALLSAEALVRWQHPQLGLIPPGQFIPLAEETGLIGAIGEWVIEEVCRQLAAWQTAGRPPLKVAVNLSSRQLRPDLPDTVRRILARHGVEARWLEFELTESMLMRDAEDVIGMMQGLRSIGVSLSLDDFGTGFSSLAYLKRFPIDKLKIDQSFVRGIPADRKDMAIIRSIINLAKFLELKVLAEGVETAEQSTFLKKSGCEQVQGFLFSRPLEAAAFDLWRQARR